MHSSIGINPLTTEYGFAAFNRSVVTLNVCPGICLLKCLARMTLTYTCVPRDRVRVRVRQREKKKEKERQREKEREREREKKKGLGQRGRGRERERERDSIGVGTGGGGGQRGRCLFNCQSGEAVPRPPQLVREYTLKKHFKIFLWHNPECQPSSSRQAAILCRQK